MPLDTDLNQSPYFADFDANSDYYTVLYKPSVAVQARELNNVQLQLQNQIQSFANNIFVDGTITEGCNMTFNGSIPYVKILDNYVNGASFSISTFQGNYLLSSSGLYAYVFDVSPGFVSQAPNLNTLYVNYLNSATTNSQIKVFQNDEILTILSSANVAIGQIRVANTISSGNSNTTGTGYTMTVSEGVIYNKGYFINVDKQTLIVDAYSNQPDGVSVGFTTVESTVSSDQDPTLLDNAQGAPNYAAPGADRLMLSPQLTIRPSTPNAITISNSVFTTNASFGNSIQFFTLVDFVGGTPSIINQDTSYATIGQEMARRTRETSGNFVIKPFNMAANIAYTFSNSSGNTVTVVDTNNIVLTVSGGLGYIEGQRINLQGQIRSKIRKGNDIAFFPSQVTTISLGNYVYVDEFAGIFNPTIGQQINLQNAASHAVTNDLSNGTGVGSVSPSGTTIGTANILAVEYDSNEPDTPTGTYRIYLYNINMNSGKNFTSVRSLYANNSGTIGVADVILNGSSQAQLNDTSFKYLVYPTGASAVKSLTDLSGNNTAQFEFKQTTTLTFASNGVATLSIPSPTGGTNEFPYGIGPIDDQLKKNFIMVIQSNTTSVFSGNVTVAASSNAVTGNGTNFSLFSPGDLLYCANSSANEIKAISTITNSTYLTTANVFTNTWTGVNTTLSYVSGQVVPDLINQANVNILSSNSLSINMNQTFSSSFSATIFYNVLRVQAAPAKKTLQNSLFVEINTSNNAAGVNGPWSLGIPDVLSLTHVYVGNTSSAPSNTSPDIVSSFILDNGQRDLFYGPASIKNNGAPLPANTVLIVQFEAFTLDTSSGSGFLSVDSYPVDDTGETANTILTYQIPLYTSPVTGLSFDLRNSVDFRLFSANTVPYVSTISGVSSAINPANTLSLTSATYVPVVDTNFEADLQYYLGRYDKVGVNAKGQMTISDGVPSINPNPPIDIPHAMTLAIINIPPYPSLTPEYQGYDIGGNKIMSFTYYANKRYRMQDIAVLDNQIQQLQYYTALNLLEQNAQNLLLTTSSGQTRFQQGILADPFNDFSISNTLDPEFNIAIDSANSVARPVFNQQQIKLQYVANSGTTISTNGKLITLDDEINPTAVIAQPFATKVRDCSQDTMYTWGGSVTLTPDGNYNPDVTINPSVVADLSSYSNFTNLPNGWQNLYGTWNEVASNVVSSNTTSSSSSVTSGDTTTTTTTSTTTNQLLNTYQSNSTYNLGSYVTNISFQPYIPATMIEFNAKGMKPSTQLYVWFNNIAVTQWCTQIPVGYTANTIPANTVTATLFSDANGMIDGVFLLPPGTFNTGECNFIINDVPNLTIFANDISTSATTTFFGTNVSYAENNIELNTVSYAVVAQTAVNQTNTITTTVTTPPPSPPPSSPPPSAPPPPSSCVPSNYTAAYPATDFSAMIGHNATPAGVIQSNFNWPGTGLPIYIFTANNSGVYDVLNVQAAPAFNYVLCDGIYYLTVTNTLEDIDPIAQGFNIPQQVDADGNTLDGVYIAALDLYFESKDPTLGCTVQIRTMENGYPGSQLVTFAQQYLESADVNVSADASVATTVAFPAPVFLESNTAYCFVVMPDGSNPNYNIWTAEISGTDVTTGNPVYSQVPSGVLFTSSQNSTWTSYNSEFMKYTLWAYEFTDTDGVAQFVNDDAEYLYITQQSTAFAMTEPVYFANSYLTSSNTVVSNTSNTVQVSNTNGLTNGVAIFVMSNTFAQTFITNVVSVSSNTSFTINTLPPFSDNNAIIGYLSANGNLTGTVSNNSLYMLIMRNSTANSSVYWDNTGIVIGGWTGATANIGSLVNPPYDAVMPKFAVSTPSETSLTFNVKGTSNNYVFDSSNTLLNFGMSYEFTDQERVVCSKTNEQRFMSGNKSFQLFVEMSSQSNQISPSINTNKADALTIYNMINSEDANNDIYWSEITTSGNAINKYVSLTVPLANEMDAEDLVVYIGAYWPAGTEIYVYGKFLCQYDPDAFATKAWTPMFTSDTYQSSKIDKTDIHSYVFTLPTVAPSGNTGTGNTTLDADWLNTAYLNADNDGILRYTSEANVVYDTFSTFAIKIVLTSEEGSYLYPFLTDASAVATQSATPD